MFAQPERELLCQKCHQEYPIWYCDHFMWNPVAESLEKQFNVKICFLCLNCFAFCVELIVLEGNPDCKVIWKLEVGSHPDATVSFRG